MIINKFFLKFISYRHSSRLFYSQSIKYILFCKMKYISLNIIFIYVCTNIRTYCILYWIRKLFRRNNLFIQQYKQNDREKKTYMSKVKKTRYKHRIRLDTLFMFINFPIDQKHFIQHVPLTFMYNKMFVKMLWKFQNHKIIRIR